jgi:hypothetical protein
VLELILADLIGQRNDIWCSHGGRTILGLCFAQELFNNSWANKFQKFLGKINLENLFAQELCSKNEKFLCIANCFDLLIMLKLRIIPGQGNLNKISDIFK